MKPMIAIVLAVLIAFVVASVARTVLSRERAQFDGKVSAVLRVPNNDARNTPLPDDLSVLLSDGRTVTVQAGRGSDFKKGAAVRISERVAPWGEVWFKLAQ